MDFCISDTHFGHANIIRYQMRPFSCVEEMDETMIKNWNFVVRKKDTVYHLGDFAFRKPLQYLQRLNGKIILMIGNHDRFNSETKKYFSGIYQALVIFRNKMPITLSHYPFSTWYKRGKGGLHLFGHCHGASASYPGIGYEEINGKKFDIFDYHEMTVDFWDYTPVKISDLNIIKKSIED